MGIFARFRDIITSNINAMFDRAEGPEKRIKLIIREIEDTLVELRASCARVMADCKRIRRQITDAGDRENWWYERARIAVKKGRDDLAREALIRKRQFTNRRNRSKRDLDEHEALVAQYREDIQALENKLQNAREKQRTMVQRQAYAGGRMRAQQETQRTESTDVVLRFEELEGRIGRMESEADLVHHARRTRLESEFDMLLGGDEIEKELACLKTSLTPDEGNAV